MPEQLNNKIKKASKWSAITELIVRLLVPIVNMVLARLLTPDAFGIVATLNMVISFAEIFTDAGFQKYLVQHEFADDQDRQDSTNVAFWSNLVMSLFLWGIIALFSDGIAKVVGNPGLGNVLVIACLSIPLAAFSSIQSALYKRDFDFKTLFKVRLVSALIPVFITIPLAFILRSFWALVIGTLFQNLVNAVLLTCFSKWKPRLYYSWLKLKEMISFSIWSMIEQISIWLTGYVDVFIVGTMLSQYYLGLYKTSSSIVGQIMGLITSATTPILFSSLSRLQNDEEEFKQMFFRFQKIVGLMIIPLGVGIYCFSDLITSILLGSQWGEASGFIGLWGLTGSLTIVLSYFSSEVYRAKGKPKLSVLAQWLHIVVLWPVVLVTVKHGFETLYVARSLVRLEMILVNLTILYFVLRISPLKMIRNIMPSIFASVAMASVFFVLPSPNSILIQLAYVLICAMTYIIVVSFFKEERRILFSLRSVFIR
jgi:PST family polysaccharide transporter